MAGRRGSVGDGAEAHPVHALAARRFTRYSARSRRGRDGVWRRSLRLGVAVKVLRRHGRRSESSSWRWAPSEDDHINLVSVH